ncbi:transcriptional antiterminator [Paenibacillus endophyticus]|uniref:Transcriptional antiterminator n=1 Tax=Paenibacillus endophyticus TaxID=1294268 RepID=A0A7W5C4I6_9BACL|nr:PRD domain-containing protein [Paenibacillus endophyticus]MBB3151023.1 transcriptional antiterminator [Paenibacillus endophyticus]
MAGKEIQRIDRIVGNNVILTVDPRTTKEYVLFGKGLGFASKGCDWISTTDPRIEKRYRLDDEQPIKEYQDLIENIDPEVISISEKIVENVKERLGTPVQPKVYFALPNHIQFALYRLRNGMEINNPFLHETKINFPLEYEIAAQAAIMISERFSIPIPEDEIGFLALHVHSCVGTASVGQLVKLNGLVNRIVEYIERNRGIPLHRTSQDYARLVMHMRAVIERLMQERRVINPIITELKANYPEAFALASDIAFLIHEEMQVEISQDEIGYMAIHLHRLFQPL